ncbi:LytR family transcriptional regulator [Kribbella capetownensis]|uniref:LytR family transcriptional regulator n=1 Tax=Kribbella capetownensis TaxID=1572659 RepID=A0A4R0JUU7_9ACTN|nr:LytR C-terminal domain-containing protein [Kribbella capetownensis]TCC45995.1 LytR family transcriptional regulator [Kribbella capetownensis]
MSRPTDERGQVLSSLVAVLAVVAIVAGLLVLFGTRGGDSTADQPATATTPKPSTKPSTGPSTIVASVPKPGESETPVPPTEPTSAPTEEPTPPPATEPTTAPPPATELAIPPAERPAVEVYNNTGHKGLADSVAGRARQAGWTVAGADNWHGKIAESTVYYPPGMLDAANQLARDLGISRTKGALDNMKKDRLTVILTSDYTG